MAHGNEVPRSSRSGPLANEAFTCFYTTARAAPDLLSDGGGPFGFDIHKALQIDFLVRNLKVDAIIETGSCRADTTEYLGRTYPDISVRSCEIDPTLAGFARTRTKTLPNVVVLEGDSATCLESLGEAARSPLYYLDAHWRKDWPLEAELAQTRLGVVAVDDFDIGHPGFGYDSYGGLPCGVGAVQSLLKRDVVAFVGNPYAAYPYPCLQVGRRSGVGYFVAAADAGPLWASEYFVCITDGRGVQLPDWTVIQRAYVDSAREASGMRQS